MQNSDIHGVSYKAFCIHPTPTPKSQNEWNIVVEISMAAGEYECSAIYESNQTTTDVNLARTEALQFGKDIVDGKIEHLSTDDLVCELQSKTHMTFSYV